MLLDGGGAKDGAAIAMLTCVFATWSQTSRWSLLSRTAILSDLPATTLSVVLNRSAASDPRLLQRPCPAQNDAIGTLPECEVSTTSSENTRSCWPPLTISPDWI